MVESYVDDDTSAFSGKPRPQFDQMVADATAGRFDVVVVWALDRLCRRIGDLAKIGERLGGRVMVVSLSEGAFELHTADGQMRASLAVTLGQHESMRKSERVRAAVAHRVSGGRVTATTRPFGWEWVDPCPGGDACLHEDDRHDRCAPGQTIRPRKGTRRGLVVHEREAAALRHVYEQLSTGQSVAAATRWLTAQGMVGTSGSPLGPETVRTIVRNPRHAGLVAHRGRLVLGEDGQPLQSADGLAIIDVETWQAVERRLSDPARRTAPGRSAQTLMSAIAVCGKCGAGMNASNNHAARLTAPVPVYVCNKAQHLTRRRTLVDEPVVETVRVLLVEQLDRLRSYAMPPRANGSADHDREIDRLMGKLGEFDALLHADEIDVADYARATRQIRARLDDARERATAAAERPALAALLAHDDPAAAWLTMASADEIEPARLVLRELLDRVVLLPSAVAYKPSASDVRFEGGAFA